MTGATGSVSDEGDAVRTASAKFYLAFERLDQRGMTAVWSREQPVLCVHPGWEPLTDIDAILASWAAIFRGTRYVEIEFEEASLEVRGALAWLHGTERLRQAGEGHETRTAVVATNIFRRERGGWRLAVHHASPVAR